MALLVHELATNASKYGALSSPAGRVSVTTRLDGDYLELSWEESGGPTIAGPPTHSGFGTRLSELSIVQQLGGTINREWRPEGLKVVSKVELRRLVRASPE
jgi:two-component sensor histidine kinase